jgi:hypothetical protein
VEDFALPLSAGGGQRRGLSFIAHTELGDYMSYGFPILTRSFNNQFHSVKIDLTCPHTTPVISCYGERELFIRVDHYVIARSIGGIFIMYGGEMCADCR